jgi:hypothetical protein
MAGITVQVPGQAGILESRQTLMGAAIRQQFSIFSTPATPAPDPVPAPGTNVPPAFAPAPDPDPNAPGSVRRPMAGDIGKPLMTTRLG